MSMRNQSHNIHLPWNICFVSRKVYADGERQFYGLRIVREPTVFRWLVVARRLLCYMDPGQTV